MNGNFDIQVFQTNQEQLRNAFNSVVTPQVNEDPMPNFSAEAILEADDNEQMKLLCNFSCPEFLTIYNEVQKAMEIAHGGGRKGYYSPMTLFLITLSF